MRALAFAVLSAACAHAGASCPAAGARVLVDTHARELLLCDAGRVDHRYRVALGRGGVDKRKAGDKKTPLGEYPLAPGRPSAEFHLFLAVGYPTAAQRLAGYSGGEIGIHGPGRRFRFLGALSTLASWTSGCIAVARDREIDEIDAWVRAHDVRTVEITRK